MARGGGEGEESGVRGQGSGVRGQGLVESGVRSERRAESGEWKVFDTECADSFLIMSF